MTMPNGNHAVPPHSKVAPTELAYQTGTQMGMSASGPVKLVVLRLEHPTGSSVFMFPPEFATEMANGLLRAASGLEIARGFPPAGGPQT